MPIMRLAPIHPPVRPLHPDERLEFGMGGIVRVVNIRLREKALASADQWTAADRAILRKIAAKLGVECVDAGSALVSCGREVLARKDCCLEAVQRFLSRRARVPGEAKLVGSSTPKTGVRLTTVAELEGSKARWVIVDVPEHIDCSRALDWFEAHNGEPYDVASILDIAVGKPPKDNNAWYCSEGMLRGAEAGVASGGVLAHVVSHRLCCTTWLWPYTRRHT